MEDAEILKKTIGFDKTGRKPVLEDPFLNEYVNLKLAASGLPAAEQVDYPFMDLARPLLADYQVKSQLLKGHLSPADRRIQDFLNAYLSDVGEPIPQLPSATVVSDRHGLSRILSLPAKGDAFESDIVKSYRVKQGVLHNPKHDRRTTKGSFHIAEGGFPIPADKVAVPKGVFARILDYALQPPEDLMELPYTAEQKEKARSWVSLLLRPTVCPEVPGWTSEKSMEVRFFAPGNLVSNLDFVESIFGNAGDPHLPENDAGLDVEHWTGHSGCVILAPHLIYAKKKDLGLPHISEATERQKRDGVCWEHEDECYNGGTAFKMTARDSRGVVVTLIADNYFGYCKKEVKTQISFAANLYGLCEEEHAGGAIAFPSYDLGDHFHLTSTLREYLQADHNFGDVLKNYADYLRLQPEGHAIDRKHDDIFYVPEDAHFNLEGQEVSWSRQGAKSSIRLQPGITYVFPSGYKVEMVRPQEGRRWRLIGRTPEGTFCHKPCTVSGGGKSEISKSVTDAFLTGPVMVADFKKDLEAVDAIIKKNYDDHLRDPKSEREVRALLSTDRSLGSVVKLLTPHQHYTDAYNKWVLSIPNHIRQLVFVVKRFYRPEWGSDWQKHFTVDFVDGAFGNELKYHNHKLMSLYVRVGYTKEGAWRTFGLRKDYHPAHKLQIEDDITASVVVPRDQLEGLDERYANTSLKFAFNCEYRLFQRPDDAIHRGYDSATEADYSKPGNFFSNYEPLNRKQIAEIAENTIEYEKFTQPMKHTLDVFQTSEKPEFVVSSAHPRIVDGKPTKNPRYLQDRQDLHAERDYYVAEMGARLARKLKPEQALLRPVNAVLPGRRNNPPDGAIRSLCVYSPIHYMELPELFMEFISSMTGKSPSTTGAGSEGALTKSPFNMLCPISDLNNALVSYLVTNDKGFLTSAGWVGPDWHVAHDISFIVPEVWCRMRIDERNPDWLIENGYLEQCDDFEHNGERVPASVLGYRITENFVKTFFGRVFGDPGAVLTQDMLRPEKQNMDVFVDGMENIVSTHQRVAELYFEDGSIEGACPPLRALLHIMAYGEYEGLKLRDPDFRRLFSREQMLSSEWYAERLHAFQLAQTDLWQRHVAYLKHSIEKVYDASDVERYGLVDRLKGSEQHLNALRRKDYIDKLHGTIGLDPWLHR